MYVWFQSLRLRERVRTLSRPSSSEGRLSGRLIGCIAAAIGWYPSTVNRGLRLAVGLAALAGCVCCSSVSNAAAMPPPNDNYLASTVIGQVESTSSRLARFKDAQDTTEATTQTDLFNPDKFGQPLGGAGPEPTACSGTSYGKTVWYDLHPRIPGGVKIIVSGLTTAIAVYEYDPQTALIVRRVQCQVSTDTLSNPLGSDTVNYFLLLNEVRPGKAYTIQVGGLQRGSVFDSGQLEFDLTFYPDHDGDGVYDLSDACPTLPGTGKDGCPPTINAAPRYSFTNVQSGIRLGLLRVDAIPGGARVEVRCRSCGLRQVTYAGPHASSVTMTGFIGRTLPLGAKLEFWVTKGRTRSGSYKYGAIGSYISYTVGFGGIGSRVIRCLLPGSRLPRSNCRR